MNELWAGISPLEAIAVAFAIAYLLLAIRQNNWCWLAALISSILSIFVFFGAQLFMESALQIFYAGMAIYGWLQWTKGAYGHRVRVHTWPLRNHLRIIVGILLISAAFAWALSFTSQAMPFLDSLTTVAAIFTTYMVAKKVLENWIYWFVIDSISVYLYVSRDLMLYAALFVAYLVLIIVGFKQWTAALRDEAAAVTDG